MNGITPTYGISSQFDVDLDARLPKDPQDFVIEVSKAGLYMQFYVSGGRLYARVVGPLDTLLDFQSQL